MSQATAQQTDAESDSGGESLASALIDELRFMNEMLASLEHDEVEDMSDTDLVNLRTELKELEDRVEDVRKDKAEDVLEDRVEPGERLHGLHRVESHNKYVDDDVGAVIMRAVSEGLDYTDFVDLDAGALDELDEDIADIGRYEYTYFR